jgi:hypothetical protein
MKRNSDGKKNISVTEESQAWRPAVRFPTFSDSLIGEPTEGFRRIQNKAALTLSITNNILQI